MCFHIASAAGFRFLVREGVLLHPSGSVWIP